MRFAILFLLLCFPLQLLRGAPAVANPSFEANPGTAWPGYGGIILHWVATPFCGIDPLTVGVGFLGDPYSIWGVHSFGNNGIVPDGTNVAFLASPWPLGFVGTPVAQSKSQISQQVSGWEVGKSYVVTYYANNRAGGESPFLPANLTVFLGGTIIHGPFQVTPIDALRARTKRYPRYSTSEITPGTSDPMDLVFRNENMLNDASILLDLVEIYELGPLKLTGARRMFQNHQTVLVSFSHNVDPATATNPEHYNFGPEIRVIEAAMTSDPKVVRLMTSNIPSSEPPGQLTVQFILDTLGKAMFRSNSVQTLDTSPFLPSDFGSTLPAHVEDFDTLQRNPNWLVYGPAGDVYPYFPKKGFQRVGFGAGNANHLLYADPEYNHSVQEILAKVRVVQWSSEARIGLAVVADSQSGQGINFLFKQGGVCLESDEGGVSREFNFSWQTNQWYWMKVRHAPGLEPDQPEVQAKIWLADGDTPEPAQSFSWDYAPAQPVRSGFAGLTAGSHPAELEVDYLVIQAEGLPRTLITPPKPPLLYLSIVIEESIVKVSWPGGDTSRGYILEARDELEGETSWQSLTISNSDSDEVVHEEEYIPGMRFYRLVK